METATQTPSGESLAFSDHEACRRYFRKFGRIIDYLHKVAVEQRRTGAEKPLDKMETDIIEGYLVCLSNTFTALATKYLLTGIVSNKLPTTLEIDRSESGFPLFPELLQMANDLVQTDRHLGMLPGRDTLKAEIVDQLLQKHTMPRDLQFALSQRVYYEMLSDKALFLAQNDPQIVWLGKTATGHQRYLMHWAVYDSGRNMPYIYILVLEDTGEKPFAQDERRLPRAERHLLAQSMSSLKLLTIANGFDKDFEDLHPKYLKRIQLGPMYSNAFTAQHDGLREILTEAGGDAEQDWLFCWTVETLVSRETKRTKTGLFGLEVQEIFDLNHYDPALFESGVTQLDRSVILPFRPYQALTHKGLPGLEGMSKYVVGTDGTVLIGA